MRSMYLALAGLTLPLAAAATAASTRGQLGDPVALNIGLVCEWQQACIAAQKSAMKKSLKYVAKYQPPQWRVHLCNKNAARSRLRVDWIGFDHCIRNEALRPPPPKPAKPLYKSALKPKRQRR
ncbi:MAG: hypothetical protein ACREBP_04865 [Sphingomicrobium sp.]